MKTPYLNTPPPMVNDRTLKSVWPGMAISCSRMFFTNDWTTTPKAVPMTTATARSTTFPRSRNFRKPAIQTIT